MLRQDPESSVLEERGIRFRQGEHHRAAVRIAKLHIAPVCRKAGVAGEVFVLEQVDGEIDIGCGERSTIVPLEIGAQCEGVGTSVRTDLPGSGKVGSYRARLIDAGKPAENEMSEVGIGVAGSEKRVDEARRANHSLNVSVALRCGGRGPGRAEGENAEHNSQPYQGDSSLRAETVKIS